MIRVFSFVGSCAGEASHTKELSDRLAAALSAKAGERGEGLSYDCVTADQLRVAFCRFSGGAKCEKLYEGSAKGVDWIANSADGGDGMAADAARLFGGR